MNATVVLDQGANVSFTNLDEISGRVVVRCTKSADVDSIVVKLEGESRTRLMSPGGGPNNEKPRPQLEYHKILYKVQMVFPPANVLEGKMPGFGKSTFTLPAGQHEYPFKFKIPFNNGCCTNARNQVMPSINLSAPGGFEMARPASRHVRKTLPPTLTGFPGEAEIRYFVKATVSRHSPFKENPRAYTPFNFFPIEPPRAASTGSEVFARQKHAFSAFAESGEPVKSKMKGIFGTKKDESASPTSKDAPFVSVDVRLPEPAILTCNQEIPLRIIVKKLNDYRDSVHLQSLQVSLNGNTKIRAHEVHRTESNSWVIVSKSNMGVAIDSPSDPVETEIVLDDRMWRGHPLPNTVAPSFETCNISRAYQLDIRIGLSYSGSNQKDLKPQSIVLPLRLETQVFSGIAPPAELLEAMAQAKASVRHSSTANSTSQTSDKLKMEAARRHDEFGANQVPPTPVESGLAGPSSMPAVPGASAEQQPPMYDDAPPSYEDAIATNLPPVDAPRPEYAPPPAGEDDVLRRDEKRGWVS